MEKWKRKPQQADKATEPSKLSIYVKQLDSGLNHIRSNRYGISIFTRCGLRLRDQVRVFPPDEKPEKICSKCLAGSQPMGWLSK
jgi:hypothetical protein